MRRASAGTIAIATHPAIASARTVVIPASQMRPACATAAEKSATTSAAESTSMAMPKLRHPGRSRFRHHRAGANSPELVAFVAELMSVSIRGG